MKFIKPLQEWFKIAKKRKITKLTLWHRRYKEIITGKSPKEFMDKLNKLDVNLNQQWIIMVTGSEMTLRRNTKGFLYLGRILIWVSIISPFVFVHTFYKELIKVATSALPLHSKVIEIIPIISSIRPETSILLKVCALFFIVGVILATYFKDYTK